MSFSRRKLLKNIAVGSGLGVTLEPSSVLSGNSISGDSKASPCGPDPLYEKPSPITMAELGQKRTSGVFVAEVSDYSPAHYQWELAPSPPHADHNPRKALIVCWKDHPHGFVFCHEASYDPWFELPNGVSLCNQFFEGNFGWGELFNNNGRKERNGFVDIVEAGPHRVWVRWIYFCVNKDDDSHPVLRGTEDYITHPNGLVWRRLTYSSLMPDNPKGYSWQPIDFFGAAPDGTTWKDLFPRDPEHDNYLVGTVIDAYSTRRYDLFWDDNGKPRKNGDAELLLEISHSRGFAMIMLFKEGFLFTIMGAASGFPSEKSQVVDHSFNDTGGWGWGAARWDHWPVGWLNSQTHHYQRGGQYPYSFGPFSHYILNHPLKDARKEFESAARDMDLNRWSEKHVYYTLTGMAHDVEEIRRLAKRWMDKGDLCARPESVVNLI